jgi:hypothetical protein
LRTLKAAAVRLHVSVDGDASFTAESNGGMSRHALGDMDETWTLEIRSGKRGSQVLRWQMRE